MAILVLSLPLIAALYCGILNKYLSQKKASIIASSLMSISAFMAVVIFVQMAGGHEAYHIHLMQWFAIGKMMVNWSIYMDSLTAFMFAIVTIVSSVVHIYSIGYMHEDENLPRFMSYLSLFTFFMLLLVSAGNFVQLFVGWEGVGLCSYLLIGFWYQKASACNASIKAFVVNRVGDFAFVIAIVMIAYHCHSLNFIDVFASGQELSQKLVLFLGFDCSILDIICLLLFVGCMGKSAQIGLHVWLPDAMEGPTPVSALIHAATMVTAGVFLVVRCSALFELSPMVLNVIAVIGGVTCLFAASIAIAQNDIKKVIAYSTCSQLGYMFLACGVSAYNAAMFHLGTHAFFKAMLFLCAGNVIHATGEQDITKLGGLRKKLPYSYLLFWLGSLAIIGIFPLAGYYSKDMILESVFAAHYNKLFAFGIVAAFFTACYSIKLIILVFHGESKLSSAALNKAHESPAIMLWPLSILAIGSLLSGSYGYYALKIGDVDGYFARVILQRDYHSTIPLHIELMPFLVGIVGIIFAYSIFRKNYWIILASRLGMIRKLVVNKYYFDEIYDKLLVGLMNLLARFCNCFDHSVIDRFGPGGATGLIKRLTSVTRQMQSGYIFNYALFMLMGLLLAMSYFLLSYNNWIL